MVQKRTGRITNQIRGAWHRHKHRVRLLKKLWGDYRRLTAALPLHRLSIGSKRFGRPNGYYPSTPDYVVSDSRARTFTIFPEERVVRYPPRFLSGEPHEKFLKNLEVSLPETHVYELRQVRYWGHYGGSVITSDNKLLADLSPDIWGISRHKIFSKVLLPRCQPLSGTAAIVSTPEAATNYWHWTFDLLPRIHLLNLAGFTSETVDYYLVNHRDLPFQRETLQDMGIPENKIVRTDGRCHFELGRAVTTSLKPGQFHVAKWVCDFLFNMARRENPTPQRRRRLYVSRRTSQFRRVRNENAIIEALAGLNFDTVLPDEMTVAEQRRAFYEAEFVVAPHGSGLTNLVYCQPETSVVEVFHPAYVDLAFWTHSTHSRLVHWAVMAQDDGPGRTEWSGRTQDMTIDIDALMKTVRAAGLS